MDSAQDNAPKFAPATELEPGTLVGGYQVLRKLGEGGMGKVYGAQHPVIGKKVAIKVLSPQCMVVPDLVRRFIEEARAVNKIGHPNIIDIFSFGELADGRQFMVMEYLEGENLADRLAREPMQVPELRRLLGEICQALEAAHRSGIVHRDLKPENIWIVRRGAEESHIKLLDFGIAKLLNVETGKMTQSGGVFGTPHFMSPEQCMGQGVDHHADIYSFGVILYLVFTGSLPFDGNTLAEIVHKQTYEPPVPPSRLRPLPPALERLILDCLEKEPERRPSSARILTERLESALTGAGAGVPTVDAGLIAGVPMKPASGYPITDPVARSSQPGTARLAKGALVAGVLGALLLGVGALASTTARVPVPALDAAAAASVGRWQEALAARARAMEPKAVAASRVPQLGAALNIGGDDVPTFQDLFEHEDCWIPFRTPPTISALVTNKKMLASLVPAIGDLTRAELIQKGRTAGMASGILAGTDGLYVAAASPVTGARQRAADQPVVLVGAPLDHAAFAALADQTGDTLGLSDGKQLLDSAGREEWRRSLGELLRGPSGRAVLLDDRAAGIASPLGPRLLMLSVFAAPPPPLGARVAVPLIVAGTLLLVLGLIVAITSRAQRSA